jgi:hypothetical protein
MGGKQRGGLCLSECNPYATAAWLGSHARAVEGTRAACEAEIEARS